MGEILKKYHAVSVYNDISSAYDVCKVTQFSIIETNLDLIKTLKTT